MYVTGPMKWRHSNTCCHTCSHLLS